MTEATVTAKQDKAPLDEVMMAMDVVDTLRHRQHLVDRELSSDSRDEQFLDRLKEIYRNQGIEVPDHILLEGVKALKEDRFTYDPPEPGLNVSLAKLYINRGKWIRRATLAIGALAVFLFGNWFLVDRPQTQQTQVAVEQTNNKIQSVSEKVSRLTRRISQSRETLAGAIDKAPDTVRSAVLARRSVVEQSLQTAERQLDNLSKSALEPNITVDGFETQNAKITATLQEQQQWIKQAERVVNEAETGVEEIRQFKVIGDQAQIAWTDLQTTSDDPKLHQTAQGLLRKIQTSLGRGDQVTAEDELSLLVSLQDLPQSLDDAYAQLKNLATEQRAVNQARELGEHGLRSLRSGDVRVAQSALRDMQSLRETLSLDYRIRIVSRPDVKSVVWRTNSAGVRNYYLIVEAVDEEGNALSFPITSEEDQTTTNAEIWGLRVSKPVYDAVYRDKEVDGIVNDTLVARKEQGRLDLDYRVPLDEVGTDGAPGAITRW